MNPKQVLELAAEQGLALTFDDVRLRTGHSEIMPDKVNLASKFSRNISLNIPITSAAMDTVTEYRLAVELAKLGGLGVIHRGLTIEEQASQVAKVKYHLNGLIDKPICVNEDETVSSILLKIERKNYNFHSFPVLNSGGKLAGLITGRDFEFCDDLSLKAKDIMTSNIISAPTGTTFEQAYSLMKREKKRILPLVTGTGEISGMYIFSDLKRIKSGCYDLYNVDNKGQLRVAAAIGTGPEALERVSRLREKNIDVVVIDTAHGDSKDVFDTLKEIKRNYSLEVVVGNVSMGESAKRLADVGADGIKVGQGPGSICTTRIIAGVGRPQVSAVYDCARAVNSEIPVCADGGLRNSGDIVIAIAAGANSVMLGSMLAGTDESPGEIVFFEGRQWKDYRGMGSLGALKSSKASRSRYRQLDETKLVPEGVEGLVPYKGKLGNIIIQYIGGLRAGMGYVGAASIQELRDKGQFDRFTSSGVSESHPHTIRITKDAPNYKP
ncbi:MAG: IMP dehydrogenase [archaeon]